MPVVKNSSKPLDLILLAPGTVYITNFNLRDSSLSCDFLLKLALELQRGFITVKMLFFLPCPLEGACEFFFSSCYLKLGVDKFLWTWCCATKLTLGNNSILFNSTAYIYIYIFFYQCSGCGSASNKTQLPPCGHV